MINEIIKLIDAYWKFDNDQQHLSTWHDKQDLIEAVKKLKNCNTPSVSVNKEKGCPVNRMTVTRDMAIDAWELSLEMWILGIYLKNLVLKTMLRN